MKLLPFRPGKLGPKVRRSPETTPPKDFFEEGPFGNEPFAEGPIEEGPLFETLQLSSEEDAEAVFETETSEAPEGSRAVAGPEIETEKRLSEASDPSHFLRGRRPRASSHHFDEEDRPRTEDQLSAFGSHRHGNGDNVVPFRRRRRLKRSRRSPLLRWLKPLGLATAIVSLPVGAILWLLTSPRFALQEVRVETGERVPEAWIEAALQPAMGRNLVALSLPQIESRLEKHAWVGGISLRKELPGRLVLKVAEKQEVALLRQGKTLSFLDSAGEVIAPYDPSQGVADQILVSLAPGTGGQGESAAAIEVLEEIAATRATWASDLSEIEVLGRDDFRVHSTVLPFPLLVRQGTVKEKARRLESLMPQLLARYGASASVDLRFARRIILQPSAEAPPAAIRASSVAVPAGDFVSGIS